MSESTDGAGLDELWPMTQEWELLRTPIEIDLSANKLGLPQQIVARRDAASNIGFEGSGAPSKDLVGAFPKHPVGSIIARLDVAGTDGKAAMFLEHIAYEGFALDRDGPKLALGAEGIRKRWPTKGEVAVHTQWYANGPGSQVAYTRKTVRRLEAVATSDRSELALCRPSKSFAKQAADTCSVVLVTASLRCDKFPSGSVASIYGQLRSTSILETCLGLASSPKHFGAKSPKRSAFLSVDICLNLDGLLLAPMGPS